VTSWATVHPWRSSDWSPSCWGSNHQSHVQSVWFAQTSCRLEERWWAADWRSLPCHGRWEPRDIRESVCVCASFSRSCLLL